MPDPAIPAATLIVMRDRDGVPPEVLMVERSAGMAFAGGAMVFPGGRIDAADDEAAKAHDQSDAAARIAAIRETIEETAVAVGLSPTPGSKLTAELAVALHNGEQFTTLLSANGLSLDLDQLTLFARWKPAFHQARIFDTLFFVAEAPSGEWLPSPQPGECEAVVWIGASELLQRIATGQAAAIFPTIRNLERLARFASIDEARADALAHPVETISPWVEEVGGVTYLRIPEGLGYPVTREPLENVRRGFPSGGFPAA
ncbi:MAG: NUDIX domain-containing protein [Sphingomicrobium sp.]